MDFMTLFPHAKFSSLHMSSQFCNRRRFVGVSYKSKNMDGSWSNTCMQNFGGKRSWKLTLARPKRWREHDSKTRVSETGWGPEVSVTASGSRPMTNFGINSVELSGCISRDLFTLSRSYKWQFSTLFPTKVLRTYIVTCPAHLFSLVWNSKKPTEVTELVRQMEQQHLARETIFVKFMVSILYDNFVSILYYIWLPFIDFRIHKFLDIKVFK